MSRKTENKTWLDNNGDNERKSLIVERKIEGMLRGLWFVVSGPGPGAPGTLGAKSIQKTNRKVIILS